LYLREMRCADERCESSALDALRSSVHPYYSPKAT
jgi:hypothetical protein